MIYYQCPPFNPVALGVRSTLQVPKLALSLGRIVLRIAGAITKATITEIVVKVGSRTVFGPISGTQLDKINKYRGLFDETGHLTIDFCERDFQGRMAKEVGALDLVQLGGSDVFVEVVNNAAAGVPTLEAVAGYTALQFDPSKPARDGQLINKLLRYVVPSSGGTLLNWTPDFRGALVKRVFFEYAGTDWTAGADGNVRSVLVRKNGLAVWDNVRDMTTRFLQSEQRRVPQTRLHVVDFTIDNVAEAMLTTSDARDLRFDLQLGAADTLVAFADVLDVPNNL